MTGEGCLRTPGKELWHWSLKTDGVLLLPEGLQGISGELSNQGKAGVGKCPQVCVHSPWGRQVKGDGVGVLCGQAGKLCGH